MTPAHIDDFYYIVSEALCELHAAFPVRHLLLVEDLSGPIKWDMTGVPDRRSRACFEALIWLADCGLVDFRSLEARDTGVEGAVLTQRAFVLLTGEMRWEGGDAVTRIQALHDARDQRAYADLGAVIRDILRANCHWDTPFQAFPLSRSETVTVIDEAGEAQQAHD